MNDVISDAGAVGLPPSDTLPSDVYGSILQTVSDAIVSVDVRQVIVLFNEQAERLFGYSRQEVLGQPLAMLLPESIRHAHGAHVKTFADQTISRRTMGEALDLAARRKNGETFPVEVSISRLGHGDRMLLTAIVRDVTTRQRTERLLQGVVDATSETVDTEFFRHLVRSLAEANGVSSAYLSLTDTAGDDAMRTVAFWHDGRFLDDLAYRVEGTPSAQVASRGLVYCPSGAWAEFSGDRWLQDERIEGYLGLPLRHTDGSFFGVMALMSRQAIELTGHVEAALRVFAGRAAVEIERQRRETALQESEERFRAQYRNSPLQAYTYQRAGDDFRLVDCNDAARQATGGQIDRLFGKSVREIYADQPGLLAMAERCFRERRVIRAETEFVYRTTGKWTWIAASFGFVPPDLVMVFVDDITDRKGKEQEIQRLNDELEQRVRDRTRELEASEARLADAQRLAQIGSWEYETDSGMIIRSAEMCRILGLPLEAADSFSPRSLDRIHPDDRDLIESSIRTALETRGSSSIELRVLPLDGPERVVLVRSQAAVDPDHPGRVVGTMQDVTEQRATERELFRRGEMLRQSQKMEAVGTLAGGVAHDFNNLLTIVRGHAEELIERLPGRDPGQRRIAEIICAVDRVAALTAQLLAFGRKQPHMPKPIDLDEAIGAIEDMLARLGGKRCTVVRSAEHGLHRLWADQGEIEQILMNLVVNARDAMPHGGPIVLETGNVRVDEPLAERLGAPPGEYVKLVVRDRGVGMDAALQARVFEPFFTTKALGKGAGLGLSTVYGIVQKSGGYIALDSAPGKGTSVAIYFPRFGRRSEEDETMAGHARPDDVQRGGETILLAEDEDGVREMVAEFLESRGYRVLAASDGAVALCRAEEYAGPIHLLLTDVVMPVMNGPELVDRMRRTRPETRVLFMSGFAPEPAQLDGAQAGEAVLIRKPFALDTLAHAVRDTLDRPH
jgi:PAS domain S-box-containing protein